MLKKWFAIHTYAGHENKVRANLERAIQYAKMQDRFGEILIATEDFTVMKDRKKTVSRRKTFPSYVLVEMELDNDTRALVTGVPGVTHFLGDDHPVPLSDVEIARIRGQGVAEKGKVTTEVPFKVGESIKVSDGPFSDFVGQVDEINLDRGKVRVMVSIFGRPTPVELDFGQVQAI
jgi:transcription termination/antitermination protein NusG